MTREHQAAARGMARAGAMYRKQLAAAEAERDQLAALLANVAEHIEAAYAAGEPFDEHLTAARRALIDDEPTVADDSDVAS